MKRLFLLLVSVVLFVSCKKVESSQQKSDSGVSKATVKVNTNSKGHTVEQENYMEKTTRDNETGSMKHLYIISSYTGDVMEYSTVRGKVTSGGKRLSPTTVFSGYNNAGVNNMVTVGGERFETPEMMDEYGMYGNSMPYVYWFDAQDMYHQYFPSGGTYLHISDKPLVIRKSNLSVSIK